MSKDTCKVQIEAILLVPPLIPTDYFFNFCSHCHDSSSKHFSFIPVYCQKGGYICSGWFCASLTLDCVYVRARAGSVGLSQTGLYPLRRSRPDSPGPDRSVLRAAEKVLRSRGPVKPERIRYNNNNNKTEVCVSGARAVIRSRERSESSPSPREENTLASLPRLASPASHHS